MAKDSLFNATSVMRAVTGVERRRFRPAHQRRRRRDDDWGTVQ
jgi:hypothetical protein